MLSSLNRAVFIKKLIYAEYAALLQGRGNIITFLYPPHDDLHHVGLLIGSQRPALRDMVPLLQAATAAAGGGVLGDEDGGSAMAHRGLPAIIGNDGGSQTLGDDLASMLTYRRHPLVGDNRPVLLIQIETAAKT